MGGEVKSLMEALTERRRVLVCSTRKPTSTWRCSGLPIWRKGNEARGEVRDHVGSDRGEYIRLIWEIAPLTKSFCDAGDDQIDAAAGRSRTRNSHRKALRHVPAGLGAPAKTAQMWFLGLVRKSEAHVWLKANIFPLANDMQNPDSASKTKVSRS